MPVTGWKWADRAGGAILLAIWGGLALDFICFRLEWSDWVNFALPAANLVETGHLAVPQLGSQFGFDKGWLFSSAVMGLGPTPLFALFGVGRNQYLAGIALLAAANAGVFAWAARRALGTWSWAVAGAAALVFLAARGHTDSLSFQRYDLAAFAMVLLAFFPAGRSGYAPWQAAVAGMLPLAHPAVAPLAPLWLIFRLIRGGPGSRATTVGLFAAGAALSAGWYARPEGFFGQFLPHLSYPRGGAFDIKTVFEGMKDNWSWRLGYPSAALFALEALAAMSVLSSEAARAIRRARGRPSPPPLPAGVLEASAGVALGLAWDAASGFHFLRFYMLGLGPCFLALVPGIRAGRAGRVALGILACAGIVNLVVMAKMAKFAPSFAGQRDAVAFVASHSRAGERIALGPPFVLPAAEPSWQDGRSVARVVPQALYLAEFDPAAYRDEVSALTDVYIGDLEWFYRPAVAMRGQEIVAPLYRISDVEEFDYSGQSVIVARKR